jgi:hypothetical protein
MPTIGRRSRLRWYLPRPGAFSTTPASWNTNRAQKRQCRSCSTNGRRGGGGSASARSWIAAVRAARLGAGSPADEGAPGIRRHEACSPGSVPDSRGKWKMLEPFICVERAELARLNHDETTRQQELREAHRLFLEIGAPIRAEQVAKELAG